MTEEEIDAANKEHGLIPVRTIKEKLDEAYNLAIDHAIEIVNQHDGEMQSWEDQLRIETIISKLKSLKK